MIYTTVEYIGMGLLVAAFLGAGYAIARLDHALVGEPESEDPDATAHPDTGAAASEADGAAPVATARVAPAPASAPRAGATRRARRKHGR